jgi:hypothetical protein
VYCERRCCTLGQAADDISIAVFEKWSFFYHHTSNLGSYFRETNYHYLISQEGIVISEILFHTVTNPLDEEKSEKVKILVGSNISLVSWQDNPFKNQLKSLHLRGGCEE